MYGVNQKLHSYKIRLDYSSLQYFHNKFTQEWKFAKT